MERYAQAVLANDVAAMGSASIGCFRNLGELFDVLKEDVLRWTTQVHVSLVKLLGVMTYRESMHCDILLAALHNPV